MAGVQAKREKMAKSIRQAIPGEEGNDGTAQAETGRI
jgi:hypothetical protein